MRIIKSTVTFADEKKTEQNRLLLQNHQDHEIVPVQLLCLKSHPQNHTQEPGKHVPQDERLCLTKHHSGQLQSHSVHLPDIGFIKE